MGNYFFEELTSETFSAYSITDEVLLFGDYNLNYFNKRESALLDEFASNSGFTLSNTEKPTRATSHGITLIDHRFSSKNQIQDVQIFSPSVEMDHLIVLYSTKFLVEPKNSKQSFISKNKRKFDVNKFRVDLSNQDWSNLYQCEDGNIMYNAFINLFSTTLEFHAPLVKNFQSERKIAEKLWLTKELREEIAKKHRLFNIWKKKPSEQAHNIFKYQRSLVNRRLKTAQNEFCKQFFKELPTSEEQWSFIKKRIGKERECFVIDKLVDGETEVENKLDIANYLNTSFQKLGLYNGQYVSAPNSSRIEVREKFCFRTVTLKEVYDAIDSLDNNKSPGPGVFNAWAIKAAKLRIGTYFQFVFNTCISQSIFPENLKIAFISPVYQKGDVKICENYRPISSTPMFAKLFERLLLNQVNEFMQEENILNGTQFGFQKHKSSTDAVLHLIEALQENYDN